MISPVIEKLMLETHESLLIPAENVANVMKENPLEHALLVLSKVGYSTIPVLDKGDSFAGLLSLNDVVNKMLGADGIDSRHLNEFKVADVMKTTVPTIDAHCALEDILHLLVDASFLPVVDKNGIFKGIVTRKEVLKAVNRTFHELERQHQVAPKVLLHINSTK